MAELAGKCRLRGSWGRVHTYTLSSHYALDYQRFSNSIGWNNTQLDLKSCAHFTLNLTEISLPPKEMALIAPRVANCQMHASSAASAFLNNVQYLLTKAKNDIANFANLKNVVYRVRTFSLLNLRYDN